MKYSNSNTNHPYLVFVIFSIAAIIFACIALRSPFIEFSIDNVYNKTISIIGIIVGVFGVVATVYFVVMGLEIYKNKKEIEQYKEESKNLRNEIAEAMKSQYKIANDLLSSIEGEASNTKYIKLARCRLVCGSPYSSVEEKLDCIPFIQECSNPKDIELLQKIVDDLESKEKRTKDENKLKVGAEEAIKAINKKMNP